MKAQFKIHGSIQLTLSIYYGSNRFARIWIRTHWNFYKIFDSDVTVVSQMGSTKAKLHHVPDLVVFKWKLNIIMALSRVR